jgi:diguanylate cyclase (GGDEF)-like protein
MVTIICRFRVCNGLEEEVRQAFLDHPCLVEKTPGFCGLEVLTDGADPAQFLLLTRWTDEESFRAWDRGDGLDALHKLIPQGLKLDASFTSVVVGTSIHIPAGATTVVDALEGQTGPLSQWLMESEAVFVLLLAPDGTIRTRNRAAERIFPADPAIDSGQKIWDYLVSSDADHLRLRLSESEAPHDGSFLLNLTDGEQSPITWEAALLHCSGAILLLGTQERQQDSHFYIETLKLTNDLSMMMREAARKNRELQDANATIERLARTDSLTGLVNRRTLNTALLREIARAERQGDWLSLIAADLDHFKAVNDQYGHKAGDQALERAALVFGIQMRPYDLAARYGGDEFMLMLPGTSTDSAIAIAERVRRKIAEVEVPEGAGPLTASMGVASWSPGDTMDSLLARADAALYVAKRTGGNRIEPAWGGQGPGRNGEILA